MPIPPQPQGNPLISNPQLFAQMLQQQGYSPQSNLAGAPPPQGGGMPQGQPPQGGPPQQAGQAPAPRPPMPGAGGPAQGPQGIPPQMLQQMMAQHQQQQGATQGGQPQGQPQIPPQLQQMLMRHMMQQHQNQPQGGQQPQGKNMHTPQELAALGRMGDTTVAHLTPGEVEVPPQVQTPKVLATIDKAFKDKKVDPQKFVAGSPKSSINPQTGMPEYNFWSSFLPMAMGIGGGLIGGPLGAAAGDAVGGMATGNSFGSSLMGGALTGLGDWGGGALASGLGGGGDAANTVGANGLGSAGQAPTSGLPSDAQLPQPSTGGIGAQSLNAGVSPSTTQLPGAGNASGASQPSQSMLNGMFGSPSANISSLAQGNMPSNVNYGNLLGAGAGAGLGSMFASPNTPPGSSTLPSVMTQPYKTAAQLPSWQAQVGTQNYQGATPSFTNYNPATNFPTAYNFYTGANGQPQTTTPAASG